MMSDTDENTGLMDPSQSSKKAPDWSRFGLSQDDVKPVQRQRSWDGADEGDGYQSVDRGQKNELYVEDQVCICGQNKLLMGIWGIKQWKI